MSRTTDVGSETLLAHEDQEDSAAKHSRVDFPWQHYEDSKSKPNPVRSVWRKFKQENDARRRDFTPMDWAAFFIPCFRWLRVYKIKEMLVGDIMAGISVGFMIVAQGLSYATTAGVPAVYGLYGSFLPCIVYSLVGTSKQLAVGPVAVTSLLISTNMKTILPCSASITNANAPGDADAIACQELYNHKVIQLAFIVACMYTSIGILRLGWVTNFLSHAVISGFTSGAAIIIGLGQLKYIVGYSVKPTKDTLNGYLEQYIKNARNFKWQEFIMGTTLLLMLIAMKEAGKRFPRLAPLRMVGPITACVIGLLATMVGHADEQGIRIVGSIPSGLPSPTIGWWGEIENVGELMPTALVVMVVDLLESTSIARALARKNGYQLNYNLEIIGLGLANFAGAAFSAYTTTGSFSRSAVNDLAGSKSPLSQFVTAWVVGLVLLTLTGVFSHLPFNVLGAVVLAAVVSLFDYEQSVFLWRVSKLDFLVWWASFLGTIFISVEIGLAIAIGLAVVLALYQIAFPHTAVLGHVPGTSMYRNVKQYPSATLIPGILAFRIDSTIFFANAKALQDRIQTQLAKHDLIAAANNVPGVQFLILDLTPVSHMDAMGLHLIEELVFECTKSGRQLALANPSGKILEEMEPLHLAELVGKDWIFPSTHDATKFCSACLAGRGMTTAPIAFQESLPVSFPWNSSDSESQETPPRTPLEIQGGQH